MLEIAIIGDALTEAAAPPAGLAEWVAECQAQYSFRLSRFPLARWEEVAAGTEPLLAFVEAPAAERGNRSDTWRLLGSLQRTAGGRLTRAFVVSTGEDFDSEEAQQAWMEYGIVVGYDLKGCLERDDVNAAVAEMAEMAAERRPSRPQPPVGRFLRMPLGEIVGRTPQTVAAAYERHKLNHFLTNGMRVAVRELREATQAIAARHPAPGAAEGRFVDPFSGKTPTERFDEVAEALYHVPPPGRARGARAAPGARPAWLEALPAMEGSRRFAPHVLLLGRTGTGKTLLARWMHQARFGYAGLSEPDRRRAEALFQDLNCGGIPPALIDSELFGGLAGAWSSLDRNTPGKIFCACGGTLFLDEIGDMPLHTQAILLKFLDDGGYYPVGGHGEKLFLPVTVIAATNRPLAELTAGALRGDLLERFRFRISLPGLKERREHLDALADYVLQNPQINPIRQIDPETGEIVRAVNAISRRALRRLREHDWPGNFRELEQTLWRGVFQASQEGTDLLLPRHLVFSTS